VGCAGASAAIGTGLLIKDKGRYEKTDAGSVSQIKNFKTEDGKNSGRPVMIISSGAPYDATQNAVEALGGMSKFIKAGESVVIKPNIGWDRTPIQAANTNPLVVAALVDLCIKAGASKVVVTDHSCNDPARCFTRSGIWKYAKKAGAEVILPVSYRFKMFNLKGEVLGDMPVLTDAINADKFINAPIAKHHGLSGFTGALKNLYGVLGGRRNRLHQKINYSIADLADFIRPTLTVMDATRVLFKNGPQGGNIADTKNVGKIVASTDQVAVDAYSCRFIGLKPEDLPYLAIAARRGLGISDLNGVIIREI
jgi:uncharacterized protein (DUF362 family)